MPKYQSNGFGSVEQPIHFSAPSCFRGKIQNSGPFTLLREGVGGDALRDLYLWVRKTTSPDNDETIVWEMRLYLSSVTDDWEIEWE